MGIETGKPRQENALPLDDSDRRRIGSQLRELYEQIDQEPLPNRQIDLLLELRHKERNRKRAWG